MIQENLNQSALELENQRLRDQVEQAKQLLIEARGHIQRERERAQYWEDRAEVERQEAEMWKDIAYPKVEVTCTPDPEVPSFLRNLHVESKPKPWWRFW